MDFSQHTQVFFQPEVETIIIDRSKSTSLKDINTTDESSPHTLFTQRNSMGEEVQEELTFHVYFDGSVLEVFINERIAISTRVYPQSGTCCALRPFVEYSSGQDLEATADLLLFNVWSLWSSVTQS
jgi:beta-fructofuranosidase